MDMDYVNTFSDITESDDSETEELNLRRKVIMNFYNSIIVFIIITIEINVNQ